MDVAIVTGASSSLGAAISRRLIDQGFRVYGLGGDFSNMPFDNVAFKPVSCNLAEPEQVEKAVREIVAKEKAVCLVVNNAKVYPPEDLRQATTAQLQRSLAVNLLCPLIVVREALAGLQTLQGLIVNIASATPETGRGGAVGAATTGGLRWMGEQLFQEWRDAGVKVTTICPEPNRWRPVDVRPADGQTPQTLIDPAVVAQCVADLALNRSGNIITEIVLRPQRIVEKPVPPVRELPYPKPQPIPYTVPREVIEAEEENENAELDARDAERAEKKGRRRGRRRRGRREDEAEGGQGADTPSRERGESAGQGDASETKQRQDSDKTSSPQSRREDRSDQRRDDRNNRGRDRRDNRDRDRDRRDDRNRDRPRSDDRAPAPTSVSSSKDDISPAKEAPQPPATQAASTPDGSTPAKKRRRKPRPGALESAGKVPFPSARREDGASTPAPAAASSPPPAPAKPAPSSAPAPSATKAPKPMEPTESAPRAAKKAAKKVAAKKAAKKAASKKTATKTVAAKKTAAKKVARKATKKAAAKSTSPET